MKRTAPIEREYGPFPGVDKVHGVSYDGRQVWLAGGDALHALDPASGELTRTLPIEASAGTAFDGRHLYQIAGRSIRRIDPASGAVLATIPAPAEGCSGMAWAEGSLWVGEYAANHIHRVDPATGAVLCTLATTRHVTGVTWLGDELWHGTWEGEASDLRRIDPASGALLDTLELPQGVGVSGLESDGRDRLFCGGGSSGKLRVVRRSRDVANAQDADAPA